VSLRPWAFCGDATRTADLWEICGDTQPAESTAQDPYRQLIWTGRRWPGEDTIAITERNQSATISAAMSRGVEHGDGPLGFAAARPTDGVLQAAMPGRRVHGGMPLD
jgi:hypothetical protein